MKYEYSVNGKTYTLPEDEVQAFLEHYPNAELIKEISDALGNQTGVAEEAATVAPDDVAAATGLASGGSLSESPSLAAPLQAPVAQIAQEDKLNKLLQQKISGDNLNIEEQAKLLFKVKTQEEDIGFDMRTGYQKALDWEQGRFPFLEKQALGLYKEKDYDADYANWKNNLHKTKVIGQEYMQRIGVNPFGPSLNSEAAKSFAGTAIEEVKSEFRKDVNLDDDKILQEISDLSIQKMHDADKYMQNSLLPSVLEMINPQLQKQEKLIAQKYNIDSAENYANIDVEALEAAQAEFNEFAKTLFYSTLETLPEYTSRAKAMRKAVNNKLQEHLTTEKRKELGLDKKTELGEQWEKTFKGINNSFRGTWITMDQEDILNKQNKIDNWTKQIQEGTLKPTDKVNIGTELSEEQMKAYKELPPSQQRMAGIKEVNVESAIKDYEEDIIKAKARNLERLPEFSKTEKELTYYKDYMKDIEDSDSVGGFVWNVIKNTPEAIIEQLPQLALALTGVGVYAQELGNAYFDTIYAQMDKDGVEHSEENFIKYLEEGRGNYDIANKSATIQQILEIGGGATIAGVIYKNIGKKTIQSMMTLGMTEWAKRGGYKALVAGGGKSSLTEFLTETFQAATEQLSKGISVGDASKYIDAGEIGKSGAMGAYVGFILPFGANIASQSAKDIQGAAIRVEALKDKKVNFNILKNMEKNIKLAEEQNKITPLESETRLTALMDVINAGQKIRKEVTGKDRVKALELQVEKQQIENEIESLDKDVDKSDLETRKGEIIGEMNEIQKQALGKLSTAGARKIAEAEGVGFKEFDSTKETKSFIKEERAKGNKDIDITQSENYGFIIQNRKTGEQTIVLNKEEAKKDNVVTTAAHELLHGVLKNTFTSAEIQTKIGQELANEMNKMTLTGEVATDSNFADRWNAYHLRVLEKGDKATVKDIGNAFEEGLNLLSEGLLNGEIAYNETTLVKIGDMLRRALSQMGIKAKFNTGKDVFNFVRDYNKSVIEGKLTTGQQKVMAEGAGGKLVDYAKSQEGVEEMGLRDTEVKTSATKAEIDAQLYLLDRSAATRFKEMEAREAKEKIEGGPLTGKTKEARLEEARKIVDNEIKSSLKIPEISKENKETAAKNQELITIIKDPNIDKNSAKYIKARRDLYNNNQGAFTDIINKNFNRQLDTNMEENDLRSALNEIFADAERTWTPDKGAEFGAWFRILVNKKLPGAYKIVESRKDPETGKKVPIPKRPIEDFKTEGDVNVGGVTVQKDPNLKEKEKVKKKLFTKKLGFDKIIIPGEFKIDKGGEQVPKTFADVFTDAVAKTFGTKLPSLSNIKEFKKDFIKKNRAELTPFIQNLTRIEKIKDKDGNVIKEIDHFKQFIDKNFDAIIKQLPLSVINKKYPMLRDAIVDETGKRRREPTKQGNPMFKKIQQEKADFLNHFTSRELNSSTRSDRKQSLLRTIVDELSADAALEVTKDKTIMQKFKDVQEIEGQVVPENFIEKIVKELDRSLDNLNKLDAKSSLKFESSKLALNTIKNSIKNGDGLIQARGKAIRAVQEEYGYQGINTDIAESYRENIVITKSSINIHDKGLINNDKRRAYADITRQLEIYKIDPITGKEVINQKTGKPVIEKVGNLVASKDKRGNTIKVLEEKGVPAIIDKFGDRAPLILWSLGRASFANSKTFGKDKFILFKGRPGFTKWFQSLAKNPEYGKVFKKYRNIDETKLNALARKELGYTKERGSGTGLSDLVKEINPKTGRRKFDVQADKKRAADAMGLYDAIIQAASKNAKDSQSLKSREALAIIAKVITEPTNSLGKLAAPVLYEIENIEQWNRLDPTSKEKGRIKAEHLTPAAYLNTMMIEHYYKGTKGINIEKIKSDYSVALIPKELSTLIDGFGNDKGNLKELQHESYEDGKGHPTVKIFNDDILKVSKEHDKKYGSNFQNIKLLGLEELTTKNPEQKTYTHGGTEVKSSLKPKEITKRVNEIIEGITGLDAKKEVTIEEAIKWGKKNRKLQYWIPTSAEDLRGLIYRLVRKGKDGEADLEFYDEVLFKPLNLAYSEFLQKKQKAMEGMSAVRKEISDRGIDLQAEAFDGLTNDQVIRIYLWTKRGYDLTELVSKDAVEQKTINKVMNYVRELGQMDLIGVGGKLEQIYSEIDPETKETVHKYPKPPENWRSGGILYDLFDRYNKVERSEIFQPFFDNVEALFGEFKDGKLTGKQANRLEAALGSHWVWVMENMITRLKSGRNRSYGNDQGLNNALDWTNAAVATTMFLNSRSVTLQMISHLNFINLEDNNVLNVGKAYISKDFIPTFLEIFNSDYLLQRRAGLKIDVNLDELSRAAEGQDQASKFNAIVSALLKKGFYPTQIADSAAIAFGGAPFLINRTKTYIKQGMSKKKAHEQAFLDFMEISETTQQASRPDKISMQQASSVGKLILAFQNTPMQYARIQKRAMQDFFANRGDKRKHAGKIIHYGILQNIIFHSLQKAIFAIAFQDEATDEEEEQRLYMTANGIVDTFLAGSGYFGMIAAMGKNVILEILDDAVNKGEVDQASVMEKLLGFSPPINAKIRNWNRSIGRWNWEENRERWDELSIDNPILRSGSELIEMALNIPAARVVNKLENLMDAVNKDTEYWRKLFLVLGWSSWDLMMEDWQHEPALELKGMKKPRKIKKRTIKKRKIG